MAVLALETKRALFRSEADFNEFVAWVESTAAKHGVVPMVANGRTVLTGLSPEQAKELLAARILGRLVNEPGMLDDLRARMESDDEFVKWPAAPDGKR